MIKYSEVSFLKDWSKIELNYKECLIYRPEILSDSGIFEKKVLREYCLRMIGFLDAGRVGSVIRCIYNLIKLINHTLDQSRELIDVDDRLSRINSLSRDYVANYNPSLGEKGSISNIGHVDLTKYEFRFNYDIVKDHFDLKESDTYITYFYKFFIYAEKCFTAILEIMKAIHDYVDVEGDYLPEDIDYIGEEVKEIELFLNTIIELKDFLSTVIEGAPDDLSLQKSRLKSTVTDNPVIQSVIDRVLYY